MRIVLVAAVAASLCGAGALLHSAGSFAALTVAGAASSAHSAHVASSRPAAEELERSLSTHLLRALERLDTADIEEATEGRRFGRASGWYWSYWARGAIAMHRVTGDAELIERVLDGIELYRSLAERHAAIDGFGWYTIETGTGIRYREVTVAGLIVAPMVELLLAARTDPAIETIVGGREAMILDTIERGIAGLDRLYREDGGNGYYQIAEPGEHHGKVEPLNRMGLLAAQLFGLAELTGKAEYAHKARAIATTYKSALTQHGNGTYSWPYWPQPGKLTGAGENFWKASVSIELARAAYRAGVVFDRTDMERIAAIADRTILVDDGVGGFALRRLIDPRAEPMPPAKVATPGRLLSLGSWYAYACFREGLSTKLDGFLFARDPAFYRAFPRAAWGLAESLAAEKDPTRCGAHLAGL